MILVRLFYFLIVNESRDTTSYIFLTWFMLDKKKTENILFKSCIFVPYI